MVVGVEEKVVVVVVVVVVILTLTVHQRKPQFSCLHCGSGGGDESVGGG